MTDNLSAITDEALSIVFQSHRKITSAEFAKILSARYRLDRHQAKSIIKNLILREELMYTYKDGHSFLERSFNKPIRISSRIILAPANREVTHRSHEMIIKITGGASFGIGDHPTTRLSIRGIEWVMTYSDLDHIVESACLDIGTGSGILIIAAIMLGVSTGLGIDIDQNAIYESKKNVTANHLNDWIKIEDLPIDSLTEPFHLITANLRYPTLIRLSPEISRLLKNNGFAVISGFKTDEFSEILKAYSAPLGFDLLRTEEEHGWGCAVFIKP